MNKYHMTPLEILAKYSELELPENFCIVPFTNVILNPDGDISICRQKGTKHVVGSLKDNTLEEIWNGEYLQKWRHEFLSGDVKICQKEIQADACHLSSGSYFYIEEIKFDTEMKELPVKLTANFNGQCNLRCKMCDVWTLSNGFYDKINYWEEMREKFFPYVKEIEMLSGEPFIQKDTWRLIDEVSKINPDCVWSFTTNGHYKFSNEMFEKLSKIKIKNIIYSIDSLREERYANIRLGGDLRVVLNSLEQLRDFNQKVFNGNIALTLHFLVMKDNTDELTELIEFCDDKELMLTLNVLYDPESDSILDLTQEQRKDFLENYIPNVEVKVLQRLTRAFIPVIESLSKVDKAYYYTLLRDRLNDNL